MTINFYRNQWGDQVSFPLSEDAALGAIVLSSDFNSIKTMVNPRPIDKNSHLYDVSNTMKEIFGQAVNLKNSIEIKQFLNRYTEAFETFSRLQIVAFVHNNEQKKFEKIKELINPQASEMPKPCPPQRRASDAFKMKKDPSLLSELEAAFQTRDRRRSSVNVRNS